MNENGVRGRPGPQIIHRRAGVLPLILTLSGIEIHWILAYPARFLALR